MKKNHSLLEYTRDNHTQVSELGLSGPSCIEIPVFNANGVDPDQTPRSAASDLGLHCWTMSHFMGR